MKTIWGRLTSTNVAKAVWAAREVGLEFKRIDVGGPYGGLDTPEYGKLNPNRRIPVLDDDGYIIWESNTIVRYLGAQYGVGTLWSADPRTRGLSDRWLDWQGTMFSPAMVPAFLGLIRTPEGQRNQQAIAASVVDANRQIVMLEEQVFADGRPFVAGDAFTIGDIAVGCAMDKWLLMPIERPATPRLARYVERVRARPAAQGVLNQPLA